MLVFLLARLAANHGFCMTNNQQMWLHVRPHFVTYSFFLPGNNPFLTG